MTKEVRNKVKVGVDGAKMVRKVGRSEPLNDAPLYIYIYIYIKRERNVSFGPTYVKQSKLFKILLLLL